MDNPTAGAVAPGSPLTHPNWFTVKELLNNDTSLYISVPPLTAPTLESNEDDPVSQKTPDGRYSLLPDSELRRITPTQAMTQAMARRLSLMSDSSPTERICGGGRSASPSAGAQQSSRSETTKRPALPPAQLSHAIFESMSGEARERMCGLKWEVDGYRCVEIGQTLRQVVGWLTEITWENVDTDGGKTHVRDWAMMMCCARTGALQEGEALLSMLCRWHWAHKCDELKYMHRNMRAVFEEFKDASNHVSSLMPALRGVGGGTEDRERLLQDSEKFGEGMHRCHLLVQEWVARAQNHIIQTVLPHRRSTVTENPNMASHAATSELLFHLADSGPWTGTENSPLLKTLDAMALEDPVSQPSFGLKRDETLSEMSKPPFECQETAVWVIDCEMTEGEGRTSQLAWVAVVDLVTGDVLYDTKVRQSHPVLNYRTDITGLTAADFNDPALPDLDTALQWFRERGGPNTLICGHSLKDDLRVLRLIPCRVIDTTLLFHTDYYSETGERPGLKDLTKTYLQRDLRTGRSHHPVDDARATRDLILYAAEHRPPRWLSVFEELTEKEITSLWVRETGGAAAPDTLHSVVQASGGKVVSAVHDMGQDRTFVYVAYHGLERALGWIDGVQDTSAGVRVALAQLTMLIQLEAEENSILHLLTLRGDPAPVRDAQKRLVEAHLDGDAHDVETTQRTANEAEELYSGGILLSSQAL